jgi:pSer/pThr/pTyr-binding forkhead associated (FHA) protein
VDGSLPFCGHCGTRVVPAGAGTCANCGAGYLQGVDIFCARCGNRVGVRVSVEMGSGAPAVAPLSGSTASRIAAVAKTDKASPTQPFLATRRDTQPRLSLLDEDGGTTKTFVLERGEAIIGRGDADIRFEADHYMSPLHARVDLRGGQLWLRDLGSRNGTWLFVDGPTRLIDGDLMLVGSQILRFRRLGYPGPHPPEADSTRRMGSLGPSADVAIIEQLRADGSVRDRVHLSPGRSIFVGREGGGGSDWLFPYDQTMSGRHAEVRSEDSEFYIHDAGSRNGVAMAVRGERLLKRGQRLLLGNQILRVENA